MHEERKSRWSWFKSETSEADTGRDEHGNETSSPHEPVERPAAESVDREAWGRMRRSQDLTRTILALAAFLKRTLYGFVERYEIDLLIAENSLWIPMHIPLGVALTQFIAETEFPTIAHHHDFYWERDRFAVSAVGDFLQMAFPPALPTIQHVTINTMAQQDLAHRKGCPSILIPNVLDFENPPASPDNYSADFRRQIGLSDSDILVLQPTRVVPRKGIEQAISLIAKINEPRFKLVVTHDAGDEGGDYQESLIHMADAAGVDL